MRISDWSSDVCSSDLLVELGEIDDLDISHASGGDRRPRYPPLRFPRSPFDRKSAFDIVDQFTPDSSQNRVDPYARGNMVEEIDQHADRQNCEGGRHHHRKLRHEVGERLPRPIGGRRVPWDLNHPKHDKIVAESSNEDAQS